MLDEELPPFFRKDLGQTISRRGAGRHAATITKVRAETAPPPPARRCAILARIRAGRFPTRRISDLRWTRESSSSFHAAAPASARARAEAPDRRRSSPAAADRRRHFRNSGAERHRGSAPPPQFRLDAASGTPD